MPLQFTPAVTLGKVIISSALIFAVLITIFCPCSVLLRCHISYFVAALLIASATCLLFNLWG